MDARVFSPFIDTFFQVLPGLGIKNVERGRLSLKEKLSAARDVTALIGLSGGIRGNIAISMDLAAAKKIASIMMMGRPVETLDDIAQSAIAEMANMLSANAMTIVGQNGVAMQVSPPTLITGEKISCIVSQVKSLNVEIYTEAGIIEINIGLES
ncbi:MAG: chemotaxis protein CheX [Thermacetogeniaceae bacterium]|jgi:chemotaxis protein CheX